MNEEIKYSEHLYRHTSQNTGALEKNANEYPFSSLAGFLLLYHYKKTFHPDFEKLARKNALHFNNPHWLQFQLFNKTIKKSEEEISSQNRLLKEKEMPAEPNNNFPEEIPSAQNLPGEIKEAAEEKISGEQSFEIIPQTNEIKSEAIPETFQEQNFKQENEKPELIETEISAVEDAIAFEPLHTVDYFASQGIKINEDIVTIDKLSSQMKSFTEWLKSMKKLHPGRLAEQNMTTEKLIQSAAEESNINTEVLTEAMADVLIKQDKKEKAIEMFTKLSLINPSKSAYFAARIESIKSS